VPILAGSSSKIVTMWKPWSRRSRSRDRLSQPARTDQRDVVLSGRAQDPADLAISASML